jgi:hypothetical protein
MRSPTIRIGREIIWLDAKALRRGQLKLDHDSVGAQYDGCGADIIEAGTIVTTGFRCECGETYEVIFRDS